MESAVNLMPAKNYPGELQEVRLGQQTVECIASNALLRIHVLNEHIIRFRFTPDFFQPDFSYAINPQFKPAEVKVELQDLPEFAMITTPLLRIKIRKKNLEIIIEDSTGRVLCEDQGGYHFEPNKSFGGYYVYNSKKIQPHEYFYGLGDKPTYLNLRGRRFLNWGTDTYGFTREQDPLYRNIPFYYSLNEGIGYGIFFDNTFQSYFDFGYENPQILSFWAEGGEINYYLIYGPELLTVAAQYTLLTGRPELPPMWALGYHQSRWSYYPESRVREIASEFRKRKIPCDAIHLDIDYMDGYRCFTWDKERFPDPARLINDLGKEGFKIVTIIDPGIKVDKEYFVYRQGIEQGMFCRRQDGDLFKGKVWPGDCCFPDFTHPRVRSWWADLCVHLLACGVKGIWNDMNEPSVFEIGTFPDDVRHFYDGLDVSHRRAHNVYGMQMARASYEGMKKYRPNERPFIISRSGYSGIQRYACIWTGDNIGSWEHVWIANLQCQRLSISGISFVGTDIGGFIGEPNGELFVRYIQMAIFHPFFRGHSSADQGNKEPWAFGKDYELRIKKAIELRYQLLPYLYSAFWQYVAYGIPIIRPLVFLDQHDPNTWLRNEEFGFGDHLLICPVSKPGMTTCKIYLPRGKWYNFFTHKEVAGGQDIWEEVTPDTFPFYVKAGAVIPLVPAALHTGAIDYNELTLRVYYSDHRCRSCFYEDAGEGYEYMSRQFSLKHFSVLGNATQMRIIQSRSGNFQPAYSEYNLHVYGLPFKPRRIMIDGNLVKLAPSSRNHSLAVKVPATFRRIEIH
jgi:alpha-glucosidase